MLTEDQEYLTQHGWVHSQDGNWTLLVPFSVINERRQLQHVSANIVRSEVEALRLENLRTPEMAKFDDGARKADEQAVDFLVVVNKSDSKIPANGINEQ